MRGTKRWGLLAVAIALLAVIALGGWKYAGKGRDSQASSRRGPPPGTARRLTAKNSERRAL